MKEQCYYCILSCTWWISGQVNWHWGGKLPFFSSIMPSYFTLQLLPLMLLSGPEISFPCLCSIDSYSFLQAHLKMASGAAFCFNEVSFIKLIYHTQFIPSALWKHLFPSVSKTTTFAPYMTFLYSKFDGLFPSGS